MRMIDTQEASSTNPEFDALVGRLAIPVQAVKAMMILEDWQKNDRLLNELGAWTWESADGEDLVIIPVAGILNKLPSAGEDGFSAEERRVAAERRGVATRLITMVYDGSLPQFLIGSVFTPEGIGGIMTDPDNSTDSGRAELALRAHIGLAVLICMVRDCAVRC